MAQLVNPKKEIAAQIAASLAKLGNTPDEVAETLLREKCYGQRGECLSCPITMWVARHSPDDSLVAVFSDHVRVTSPSGRTFFSVDLPLSVKEFLASFDTGTIYGELDVDRLAAQEKTWDDESWFKAWDGIIDPLGDSS